MKPILMSDILFILFFTGLGFFNLIVGIGYWRGTYKLPYFTLNDRYLLLAEMGIGSGIFFTGIGLTGILSAISPEVHIQLLESILWSWVVIWIITLSPIVNFLLILFGAKPKWIKWLEKEHPRSISFLGSEARKIGLREWQVQVKTQADLEKWICSFGLQKPKPFPSSLSLPLPPLPPRTFLPMREEGFKPDDQVIWERHDGQRFLARVVKLSPHRVMIKLVDEGRYTLVKPENIYHI